MKTSLTLVIVLLLAACGTSSVSVPVLPRAVPLVDYHQHPVSPAFAPIANLPERDGAAPVRELDAAGIERCLGLSGMTGVKVHLDNAGISLRDPAQLARVQQLFALAQRLHAPVLVHMRARGHNYGAEDARIILDEVLPVASDVEIVIAHLGASGPGYAPQADEVMAVFAGGVMLLEKS